MLAELRSEVQPRSAAADSLMELVSRAETWPSPPAPGEGFSRAGTDRHIQHVLGHSQGNHPGRAFDPTCGFASLGQGCPCSFWGVEWDLSAPRGSQAMRGQPWDRGHGKGSSQVTPRAAGSPKAVAGVGCAAGIPAQPKGLVPGAAIREKTQPYEKGLFLDAAY